MSDQGTNPAPPAGDSGNGGRKDGRRNPDIPFVRRSVFVYPVAILVVFGFIVMALARSIFVLVLPGEVGVLYSLFFGGTQTLKVYGEGLVVKLPWNRFFTYDTRLQALRQPLYALSQEGMSVQVELSVFFRASPKLAGRLHKELGPQYINRVISPLVISTVREMISHHRSHELYTVGFDYLQNEIEKELKANPISEMIEFTDVLISRLDLPPVVLRAIEYKLEQEQIAKAYEYVLQSQRAEAERKRIEAIGIQNFYSIVSSALTPPLLTWRGIEATVEIARAPNSKVVVVGSGKDQLPIILGGEIGQLPQQPPPPVPPVSPDSNQNQLDRQMSLPRLFPPQTDPTQAMPQQGMPPGSNSGATSLLSGNSYNPGAPTPQATMPAPMPQNPQAYLPQVPTSQNYVPPITSAPPPAPPGIQPIAPLQPQQPPPRR
ncbi:prohibitin family protein [Ferrovibrio sp. MS7]|uniref:prohibitin family protein n=1 Tax=Ferrovibrio plantarum TaxID=3119164 RepID=UPI0031353E19